MRFKRGLLIISLHIVKYGHKMVYSLIYYSYICNMKNVERFLILTSRENCKIHKYKYAEYWEEGYEYVDARFLYLGNNKYTSLKYIELFAYKLFYINMGIGNDINEDDVFNVVSGIMSNKIDRGIPLYVRDIDVYKKISQVYNNLSEVRDFKKLVTCNKPSEMHNENRIIPKKKILFKKNISGLIAMNDKESEKYYSIKDKKEKEDYKFKLISRKKAMYAIDIYNKHKYSENRNKISEALDVLSEDRREVTRRDISEFTGISMSAVKDHVNKLFESVDKFPEVKVVVNQKQVKKGETLNRIKTSIDRLKEKRKKITKTAIHRDSGISRVTIDKYWDKINA